MQNVDNKDTGRHGRRRSVAPASHSLQRAKREGERHYESGKKRDKIKNKVYKIVPKRKPNYRHGEEIEIFCYQIIKKFYKTHTNARADTHTHTHTHRYA